MQTTIRTIQIGRRFTDNGRYITIRVSTKSYHCACGLPFHHIAPGDLYAGSTNQRTSAPERWHADHLHKNWKLIVLDDAGTEIARFGC